MWASGEVLFARVVSLFLKSKAIYMDKFSSDLENSAWINSLLNEDLSAVSDLFNSTLQSVMDHHAPIVCRSITFCHHAPWFTDEIKAAKRKRRRLERQWHTDRTNAKHQLYTDQCCVVNDLTWNVKEAYCSSLIEANHGNQQKLFQVINTSLYRKPLTLNSSTPSLPTRYHL